MAFRREAFADYANPATNSNRSYAECTPNQFVRIVLRGGAIRRRADSEEKRIKVLAALDRRHPAQNPANVADGSPGWTPLQFRRPFVPPSYAYGMCPQNAVHALISAAVDPELGWFETATARFYSRHKNYREHVATDRTTWWGVNHIAVFVQVVGKCIGQQMQLTKETDMMQRFASMRQKHRQLLLCESMLLVCATLTDDQHWFLVDGSRKAWYPLDQHCSVVLVHAADHADEASAIKFFKNTMQADVVHNVYTIATKK